MKVKVATLDDLASCKRLAKLAMENSPYSGHFDDGHLHDVCLYYLTADPRVSITLILCDDSGREVGLLTGATIDGPSIIATAKVASELVWYVAPEGRKGVGPIRLIKAFETWARSVGCRHTSMSCFNDDLKEPLTRVYKKLGYKSMEESFLKEL
jgi:hypothetical protein